METEEIQKETAGKKKSKMKIFWQFLFVAVNIAVVVIIATVDFGGETATVPFSEAWLLLCQNWCFFAGAIALAAVSILLDVIKYIIMIRSATKRTRPGTAYKCSQLGRYYDNATPFGAGGQPFQVHYLTQKNIGGGQAMAIVVTTFILQQLAFTFLGPYFLIHYSLSGSANPLFPLFITLSWIGYVVFLFIPLMLVLITVKPSIAARISDFFIRLLTKMRIIRNPEKASLRVHNSLDRYKQTAGYLAKNTSRVIIVFVISIFQAAIYFGIPYFVCRALGASAAATVDLFSRMVMIYFAITIIPTPGGSIVAEFGFLSVFAEILTGYVFWGILLWRLLVFYLYLAQGLIIIISRAINNSRRKTVPQLMPAATVTEQAPEPVPETTTEN